MRLYHCENSRSFRPLWTLEELGLSFELINLPFPPRLKVTDYLEINPLGTVPTLLDGDVTLTESTAICHYLVDKYSDRQLGVSPGEVSYGSYLNWLYRSDATLTFPLTLILRYQHLEAADRRLPQVVRDYSQWYLSRLRSVNSALKDGREYLVADRFTIADIAVHYALLLGSGLGLHEHFPPQTKNYLNRLMERDAFKRALVRQEVSTAKQERN